jgi:hypothetical protein
MDVSQTLPVEVLLVAVEDIPAIWPDIAPLLAPACLLTNERVTVEAVHQSLLAGDKRLFVAVEGGAPIAAVTVLIGVDGWAYIGQLGGRDPSRWLHTGIVLISQFAKLHNCRGVLINNAREEWARVLAPLGYAKTGIRLEKDFGDAR